MPCQGSSAPLWSHHQLCAAVGGPLPYFPSENPSANWLKMREARRAANSWGPFCEQPFNHMMGEGINEKHTLWSLTIQNCWMNWRLQWLYLPNLKKNGVGRAGELAQSWKPCSISLISSMLGRWLTPTWNFSCRRADALSSLLNHEWACSQIDKYT